MTDRAVRYPVLTEPAVPCAQLLQFSKLSQNAAANLEKKRNDQRIR